MRKTLHMVSLSLLLLSASSASALPTSSASGYTFAREATLQLGSSSEVLEHEAALSVNYPYSSRLHDLNLGPGPTGGDWKSGGNVGWEIYYNPGNDDTPVPDEGSGGHRDFTEISTVPEPTTLILLAIGLAGLGLRKR